jgi:hypothetical protein
MDASELVATRHSDSEPLPPGYSPPATIGPDADVSAEVVTTMGVAFGFVVAGVPAWTSPASAQLVGRRTKIPETRRAPAITVGHLSWWHLAGPRAAEREGSYSLPGAARLSALEGSRVTNDPRARS